MADVLTDRGRVPSELSERMRSAGTLDSLIGCWRQLNEHFLLERTEYVWGTLFHWLKHAYNAFAGRGDGACDSLVKEIFKNEVLLRELDEMGIPREFLLQCVRVGAIKSLLNTVERNPGDPVSLQVWEGLSRLDADGYNWADQIIGEMKTAKEAAEAAKERERVQETLQRKGKILERLSSGAPVSDEDKALIRPDFRHRLAAMRATIQDSELRSVVHPFNFGEYADQEITPATFAQFKAALRGARHYDRIPFEVLDPESPWFYPVRKQKTRTFRSVLGALHNNFQDWFEL